MSYRILLGDAVADCGPRESGLGRKYVKIGLAFRDENDPSRIAVKIDALPLASSGWTGWINVFPTRSKDDTSSKSSGQPPYGDTDIPF